MFDHARPDPFNPRYIRMDPETGYRSDTMLRFMADHGYKIELIPPRDKHAGGIAERMVGIVTAKTNNAMLENGAPPSFWCWAMFKTTQDLKTDTQTDRQSDSERHTDTQTNKMRRTDRHKETK